MSAPDHRSRTRLAYDTVAADYARLLPDLGAETALDRAMVDDFAARCAATRLGPVLDAGCGTGRVSAHLAAQGLDVLGLDLSPRMVEIARRTHPNLRFEVGALEELPVPDATAGGVLAWYSLIHTSPERLPAVAGELARVLRPGGWVLTAFQSGDGRRVDRSTAYGHPVSLTSYRHVRRHVVGVLADAGLDLRARLERAAEGVETTPQCVLLARRSSPHEDVDGCFLDRPAGA